MRVTFGGFVKGMSVNDLGQLQFKAVYSVMGFSKFPAHADLHYICVVNVPTLPTAQTLKVDGAMVSETGRTVHCKGLDMSKQYLVNDNAENASQRMVMEWRMDDIVLPEPGCYHFDVKINGQAASSTKLEVMHSPGAE